MLVWIEARMLNIPELLPRRPDFEYRKGDEVYGLEQPKEHLEQAPWLPSVAMGARSLERVEQCVPSQRI